MITQDQLAQDQANIDADTAKLKADQDQMAADAAASQAPADPVPAVGSAPAQDQAKDPAPAGAGSAAAAEPEHLSLLQEVEASGVALGGVIGARLAEVAARLRELIS